LAQALAVQAGASFLNFFVTSCFIAHSMPNAHGAEYEAMAIDDGYDPRKPEYIIPATEDEMTQTSTELIGKQISQLEVLVERRQAESNPQNFHHYEQVIAEMRYESDQRAGKSKSSHFRMRSDPAKQPDEGVNDGPRTFTHARIRSAPAPASSCDIVPPDDESPHANRVHGSRQPGKQFAARKSTYTTLLGPSVRPAVCPLPGWSKGLNSTASSRVPLRPSQGVSAKIASVSPQGGTTQRRRPSTPPMGKAMGPRPGHVVQSTIIGPLCGDLADESHNAPCVARRLPGVAYLACI